jgi:hypothetical protein
MARSLPSGADMLSSWIGCTLGVAAVWVLRRKAPVAPRPYKMFGYPHTLWAFLSASAWYMVDRHSVLCLLAHQIASHAR